MNGKILNEWAGRKLSQYPDSFGVFASASNEAPEEVKILGRKILNEMDIKGIAQPEFKYDSRDKKYKLMEINLRSMMWHRVGNLSGVNLHYSQYLDAIGEKVSSQVQIKNKDIHFTYLKYEIINLIRRRKYLQTFIKNLTKSDRTYIAVYDRQDIKPFLKDCIDMSNGAIRVLLRVMRTKVTFKQIVYFFKLRIWRIKCVLDHVEDL
jgi:predicted ATP-grasp superfamily ATP-dependent carboligase